MANLNLTTEITTAVSSIFGNYTTEDTYRYEEECRVFSIKDINNRWEVEIPFYSDGVRPFCIRAGVFAGENDTTVISFSSTPDLQGVKNLTCWLRAVLALGLEM